MKILDKYILKTFVGTFFTVFVILFFIFILQTVWLFIAELAGKDLDFFLIVKFLLFSMPRIIPLVLPLSVLLASIMTFGNFAENYEFAAMKSSGISLQRAMRSLTIFVVILSGAAFLFSNNVIPYAEFKFINFRKDIAQQKPAMAITEGQFSEVGNYNIKVDKKSGDNGNFLTGVTIHKKAASGVGTTTVIKSKNGELMTSDKSSILKLVLKDGYYYEDIVPKKYEDRKKLPFAKSSFKQYIINMDLSQLNDMGDDEEITNTNTMLNVNELTYTLDSLERSREKDITIFADNIYTRTGIANNVAVIAAADTLAKKEAPKDLLSIFPKKDQVSLLKVASSNVDGVNFTIDTSEFEMRDKTKNINNHLLALYDKFVIAYACLLMFFIGAPLGAIIRKGGLGLPIVFAILIFITFHFINTFGRRMAQENGIPPFFGSWMSSFILTPLAVLLTYRATNDISFTVNFDWLIEPLQKFFPKKKVAAPTEELVVQLEGMPVVHDHDWEELQQSSDSALIGIVKNARQFKYSEKYRIKALQLLEERGITQQQLLEEHNLTNEEYEKIEDNYEDYRRYSKIALVFYIVTLCLIIAAVDKFMLILAVVVSATVFYISTYKSHEKMDELEKQLGRDIGTPFIYSVLLGFPFYLFIYFHNRKCVKDALAEYTP